MNRNSEIALTRFDPSRHLRDYLIMQSGGVSLKRDSRFLSVTMHPATSSVHSSKVDTVRIDKDCVSYNRDNKDLYVTAHS